MVTLAGRLSAILGPLLFGVVSNATGSQQATVLSLLVFLVLGAWVLNGLRTEIAAACD
jgi:MFS-type transporter involved in bile tolerance (Atg22 family)